MRFRVRMDVQAGVLAGLMMEADKRHPSPFSDMTSICNAMILFRGYACYKAACERRINAVSQMAVIYCLLEPHSVLLQRS